MALIYIVEDDGDIAEIEQIALRNAGCDVKIFKDGKSFFKQLMEKVPELAIIDRGLPDINGCEIVKKIRNTPDYKKLPIIMVTAMSSEMDLAKGFDDGADDYISKPFSVMELISRVKALLRRTKPQTEKRIQMDGLCMDNDKREVRADGTLLPLTFKEYELLQYLLLNKGIVLSRDSIMETIWGIEYEGESRTLDMHIKTLRQKLLSYGERICTVRNVGYVIK
ncbi:MAG: response regulator transcription factor [Pseudobutyrivibrio sp.]|nr:response regulator transcription factor [Pseudobutyrivibrio sp.]